MEYHGPTVVVKTHLTLLKPIKINFVVFTDFVPMLRPGSILGRGLKWQVSTCHAEGCKIVVYYRALMR